MIEVRWSVREVKSIGVIRPEHDFGAAAVKTVTVGPWLYEATALRRRSATLADPMSRLPNPGKAPNPTASA
jgi:hypothetical protein